MSNQVVIVGGSFAAIVALKSLLKIKGIPLTITVISLSDHAWNNCSSPRLLIETDQKDKTIVSIKHIIEKNSKASPHKVNFINARVTSVELENNSLTLSSCETIDYTQLIIATGSSASSPAFKLNGDYTDSFSHLEELSRKIKAAKSIAIIGGGPHGVEVAGELGYNYGAMKNIVLYTGVKAPLKALSPTIQAAAERKLRELNVKVVNNLKTKKITDTSITLVNGVTEKFDLILPVFKSTPNTDFMNETVLDASGYIQTDDYLRVEGYPNVLAIGDVASVTHKTARDIYDNQAKVIVSSVEHIFTSKNTLVKYVPPSNPTVVIPISKNGGVGVAYGLNIPNFVIKWLKCRDFGISRTESLFI